MRSRFILATSIATLGAAFLVPTAPGASIILNPTTSSVTYTPVATGAGGSVDTRTFGATGVNETSLVNLAGTATSVGNSTNLAITAQPITTTTQFLGAVNITNGGAYTFATNSDDGSAIYVDGNLLVNNQGGHGVVNLSNTVTLDAGKHELRVDYLNNTGGGSLAVTYSGPDQLTAGVIPTANLFRAENSGAVSTTVAPNTVTALGDDVSVASGFAGTITVAGTAYSNAGLNSLALDAGSSLTVAGTANRDLRFGTTTFSAAGTNTLSSVGDIALGVTSASAVGTTIVKQGSGRLILDNAGATANNLTGATFDVQAGTLYAIGNSAAGSTNPLGSAVVQLNGGTLALDTAFGDVTFNNTITLAGTGGTVQAVSGPRSVTLSSVTPIAIGAGQTLTLNTYTGSNNANGAAVLLNAPLTGTGALTRTQTSAGTGALPGNAILAANSPLFSGPVTLAAGGGILEGRATATSDKPFGTGLVTLAGGQLNLRGGAAATATYALGNNVGITGDATLDANLFTGAATNSVFALGALTTTGARTIGINGGNGYAVTFSSVTLDGTNTTFNVGTGATFTPGAMTFNNAASSLGKAGAGTLVLGNSNTYTGGTSITGGVLAAPVISDTGTSSIGLGGTVTLNGGTLRYTGAGATTTTRPFNTNTAGGGGFDVPAGSLELAGSVTGSGTVLVTKSGTGTLLLSGTGDNSSVILNATAGLTQLNKGIAAGVRAVAGISGIATGATVQLTGTNTDQIYGGSTTGNVAAVNLTGGTLDLNGKSEGFDRLTGSGVVTNNAAAGNTSTMTVGESGGSGNFAGLIKDGASGGKVALTKVGAGVATISSPTIAGANSYTGATTISAGTLRLQAVASTPVAGSSLWLDAADAATVLTSAGKVTQWTDKSGNNRSATQTVAANQPTYINNALVGGKGVIDFAAGQVLQLNLTFLNSSSYTIFSVEGKTTANASNYYLGTSGNNNTNAALHIGYRNNTSYALAQYSNDLDYTAAPAYTGTQVFREWTDTLNTATGGGHAILLNGTQVASNTNVTPLSNVGQGQVGQALAGTQYLGDLGEILIYNSSLSASDRALVDAYINAKWFGIGSFSDVLPTATAVNITASGATLDLAGFNQRIGSLTGVAGSAVTLGAGTLTVGDGTSTSFGGSISGTAGVVKQNAGSLKLTGTNAYTGPTVVNGGTLEISGSIAGGVAGAVAVNNGTLLFSSTTSNAVVSAATPLTLGRSTGATSGTLKQADGISNVSETFSSLTVGYNSALDFGTGNSDNFSFTTGISGLDTFTLAIYNWTGPQGNAAQDHLYLGSGAPTLTSAQLGNISFFSGGAGSTLLGTASAVPYAGGTEIVVVPEPTSLMLLAACSAVALGLRRRRTRLG